MEIIVFEKASYKHKDLIFSWLKEKHVKEFWDNTQSHKNDILNFIDGRKTPSSYCEGKYVYWIAYCNEEPYAMLMTIQETHKDNIGELKLSHLSKTGNTYGIDYMIGDLQYLGKGYAARTLIKFVEFLRDVFDKKADTFFIDPAADNPRAKHVYEKSGFVYIDDFIMIGDCSGAGKTHNLLVKKITPTVNLEYATLKDYPLIQNMARFYVYDMSKECGLISDEWNLPHDGLYESFDFRCYFEDESRKAYIVKVYDEIAGFILLNQITTDEEIYWCMGEFYILGKFQRNGIGEQSALKIWQMYPGKWEILVIPENKSAVNFWENIIINYTNKNYTRDIKKIYFDKNQPRRISFTFITKS
ncbi:MAG: GNAT family N-acetyltransferase [Legionellales bacterium]|nr:GNAT family N-acetyltransferase [Legionellales bacterium]